MVLAERDTRPVDEGRGEIQEVEAALPMLADLLRCDVTLLRPNGEGAVVTAEARPLTVPSLYADSRVGRTISRRDEPAVMRAFLSGRPARKLSRVLVHGAPTVQDAFPVHRGDETVAVVAFEVGVIEHERQRRKSPVFLRAVSRFRDATLRGQAVGVGELPRLGEHDGPIVVDSSGTSPSTSSIAENLYRKLGYTQSLLGRNVAHLQTDESIFFEALETGSCLSKAGQEGPFTWMRWALPLPGEPQGLLRRMGLRSGRLEAVLVNIRDVTEERRKEQELRIKSAMIQEIHHRVKNNLQTIASLLRLQARRTGSPEVGDMLRETINRILSIAVVHEFLSHDESSIIDVREVCQRIQAEVSQGILDPEKQIRFLVEGPELPLPAQQATSCALIVNELLQNAVRHAFTGRANGRVTVHLADEGDDLKIDIVDDGRGVEAGFDYRREGSLGLQIVRTLVRDDLRGHFQIVNMADGGARATVRFPKAAQPVQPLAAQL
jgi:two-component system, sensor histidine kinase PdtaS